SRRHNRLSQPLAGPFRLQKGKAPVTRERQLVSVAWRVNRLAMNLASRAIRHSGMVASLALRGVMLRACQFFDSTWNSPDPRDDILCSDPCLRIERWRFMLRRTHMKLAKTEKLTSSEHNPAEVTIDSGVG